MTATHSLDLIVGQRVHNVILLVIVITSRIQMFDANTDVYDKKNRNSNESKCFVLPLISSVFRDTSLPSFYETIIDITSLKDSNLNHNTPL